MAVRISSGSSASIDAILNAVAQGEQHFAAGIDQIVGDVEGATRLEIREKTRNLKEAAQKASQRGLLTFARMAQEKCKGLKKNFKVTFAPPQPAQAEPPVETEEGESPTSHEKSGIQEP